jgi:hypothetical protein
MPNILWICTDEQRADTISGYNNDIVQTPRLRQLMNESVTFTMPSSKIRSAPRLEQAFSLVDTGTSPGFRQTASASENLNA